MGVTTELMDVRSYDEKWLYENYKDQLDKSLAADMKPEIFHHLRDYITMTNAFAFMTTMRAGIGHGVLLY